MDSVLQNKVTPKNKIAVIGLGYVGLPLAVALARHYPVTGYDIDQTRIDELQQNFDSTKELTPKQLEESALVCTNQTQALAGQDIYIIAVPTPVNPNHSPDLTAVQSAAKLVGPILTPGNIVVFESTVYPGVTEDICGALLEEASGLKAGKDFYLGYSPERINPGDQVHTVDKIVKVVAGQTPAVAQKLAKIYGSINNDQVFVAANIKTAEAAKVIENAQRDINIAFINEITIIFNKAGLSAHEVLKAAQTKWNFLPFQPGLVGGHCIGVDPYYLANFAKQNGHNPEVILSGRRINDHMGQFLAQEIHRKLQNNLGCGQSAQILVLGLTFKEDVPDLRNTKVIDVIHELEQHGHTVVVHDPVADVINAENLYGLSPIREWETIVAHAQAQHYAQASGGDSNHTQAAGFNAVICAVAHKFYRELTSDTIAALVKPQGLLLDLKGIWSDLTLPPYVNYWKL